MYIDFLWFNRALFHEVNMDFNVDVAEFFNAELGDELPSLSKLQDILERISNYERELENEINPRNLDPSHLPSFTENAGKALEQISELTEQCEQLHASAEAELVQLEPIKQHFALRVKELQEIQCLYNYLQWILKIEDENCNMEEAMKSDLVHQMIEVHSRFKSYWDEIRTSDCKNLVDYVKKTVSYWHDILKEKFSREFQKTLQNLHWPVLSTNLTAPLNQSPDVFLKFEQLFMSINRIALPGEFIKTEDKKESMEDTALLLPLQIMLQSLQKRFVFHFMSKKPTNRLDKPEWYLTQILTWISDHTRFMEKSVQPILDREGLSKINARTQLMRGLVNLAVMRLKSDLPCLVDDDRLLSHTIDEILLFSQELQNQGYPLSYPNVMALLTTEPCFTQWRSLEHQSALEKMDRFLSLETAWKSRYQDESDVDDMLVPESAELFVTLLLTMTERYCNLADKECQLSFLELQLELLDDFRLRLHQLSQCEMQDTIQPNYCSIMNAIYYITTVLEEWNNLPFFLQLYAYKKNKLVCEELLKDPDKQHMNIMKRKEARFSIHSEEQLLEASVFDEPIGLFQHILKDLLQILCERVMLDIKAKSRPYRKEKWFCMPAVHDKKLLEISPAAHPMLEIINSSLYRLQELLAKPLFTKVWQQIAAELNIYLYEEVILQNNFSEGGAAQLNFDVTRNLFPIFGSYTLKPENYFKLVRDSCMLLNLSSAPAMLLRETLKHQEGFESKSSALEELGVYTLSPSQALLILSQRNYTNL